CVVLQAPQYAHRPPISSLRWLASNRHFCCTGSHNTERSVGTHSLLKRRRPAADGSHLSIAVKLPRCPRTSLPYQSAGVCWDQTPARRAHSDIHARARPSRSSSETTSSIGGSAASAADWSRRSMIEASASDSSPVNLSIIVALSWCCIATGAEAARTSVI